MKRAVIYLRVSTGDQHPENQRTEVEALAQARGLEVLRVVEEKASTRGARPAFDEVLADARRRRFDVLVIWSLDRFGRRMIGNLTDVLELDRLGVAVVSVRESWLETGSGPTRKLLIAIFSWLAEQERDQRAARTKAGLDRVRKRGVKLGRPEKHVNVETARNIKASDQCTWAVVARRMGVGRATLMRALSRDRSACASNQIESNRNPRATQPSDAGAEA